MYKDRSGDRELFQPTPALLLSRALLGSSPVSEERLRVPVKTHSRFLLL